MSGELLLSFGLLADLHYIDIDDGENFNRTKIRRFRQSLSILKEANSVFNAQNTAFNLLLGDILDGKAKANNMQYTCLDTVLAVTNDLNNKSPYYYVIGNHECYNYNRDELLNKTPLIPFTEGQRQGSGPRDPSTPLYYSFHPASGFRCIVLDGYDVSTINPSTPEHGEYAETLLRGKNSAYANGDSNWFATLPPEDQRFVPFNGGIGGLGCMIYDAVFVYI